MTLLGSTRKPAVTERGAIHAQVVVLYVEQEESVRRQMHRAMATSIHNQCVSQLPPSLPPLKEARVRIY